MNEKILIIEDERLVRWSLNERLTRESYEVTEAEDGTSGLNYLRDNDFDLLLLDVKLPDIDGLQILKKVAIDYPDLLVILITAYSRLEDAVQSIRLGAYDYINKPFNMDALMMTINKALETTRLRREIRRLREEQRERFGEQQIIGKSSAMAEVYKIVDKVANSEATTILLQGESGTGKDLVARTIHYKSVSVDKPFMNITCSALPENLLESELFGHEKGSFTDAKSQKKGLFELADSGTIFLDEIGDMSLQLQAKLLRFLEEKKFKRVGGSRDISVEVRIIAATNRDLSQAVERGAFRSDLYYRLKIIPIYLPTLRERRDDIPMLVDFFIDHFNKKLKKNVGGITRKASDLMMEYDWPGNIRELRNVVERAILLGAEKKLDVDDLPIELRGDTQKEKEKSKKIFILPSDGVNIDEVEKGLITQAIERTGGNKTRAGKLLGINRDQVRYRMRKFGLDKTRG